MNDLLELNGQLERANFTGSVGISIPANKSITSRNVKSYIDQLKKLKIFWESNKLFDGSLISVFYNRIIPKSRRIERLFSENSEESNSYVRGVRFDDSGTKHIITYFVKGNTLEKTISVLNSIMEIIDKYCNGAVSKENFNDIDSSEREIVSNYKCSKSFVKTIIKDLVDIDKFDVFRNKNVDLSKSGYISLYSVGKKIEEILSELGISNSDYEIFDSNTIYTTSRGVIAAIKSEADYLISMSMPDLATYDIESFNKMDPFFDVESFPHPSNEPTIGVIDTLFSQDVFFHEWVDYKDMVPEWMPKEKDSYHHGTEVDSIIVAGGLINPKWDDNCGFFRVRHFGVAIKGENNSYNIIKCIESIVKSNTDIKVWNISLGSIYDTELYNISPEASLLDELQNTYNVIFVVSGTNISESNPGAVRIGAPADSINSVVVNAVGKDGTIPNYARKGKVLSFFIKPDLCAFGGDSKEWINACNTLGWVPVSGTSFAAPWIARKLSYLIDKLGLSREVAKALLIDSAFGFSKISHDMEYLGYGIVPTKIENVIYGKRDEIKFYIEGTSSTYNTYTYKIPVPIVNNKYPYYARAVMCYFPRCSRQQGVDYTNTELNISFGRMSDEGIESMNKNIQDSDYEGITTEKEARDIFRKWDNVKIVLDEVKTRKIPKTTYNKNTWGLRITNKGRIGLEDNIKFGVVITLKEMFGKNRIDEFISKCQLNGWIVNRINIENKLDIYAAAEEEIKFE